MAAADYYLCDRCGCKTFYDANLNYDGDSCNPVTQHRWPEGNVGWMIVICNTCAITHAAAIRELTP